MAFFPIGLSSGDDRTPAIAIGIYDNKAIANDCRRLRGDGFRRKCGRYCA